jgi:hypothetical protein
VFFVVNTSDVQVRHRGLRKHEGIAVRELAREQRG